MEDEDLSLKRFYMEAIVGQGAFGKVRIVTEINSNKQYALKYMDKLEVIKQRASMHIFRERRLLQILNSPFIVGLKYAFQDDDYLFMVIDFAKGGDLRYHLNDKKAIIDDFTLQIYTAELSSALNYMHLCQIIHRDIKPENILLDAEGHLLLTDFNIAVSLADNIATSESGTLDYMAPEMFLGQPYAYSVDWWATGTVLYECIYRKLPFNGGEDAEEIKEHITHMKLVFPPRNRYCDIDVEPNPQRTAFLTGLLDRNLETRLGNANDGLGFETQIKTHPFLSGLDWDLLESKGIHPLYRPANNEDSMNFSPALLIEEMLDGGSEICYRPRKKPRDPNAPKTFAELLGEKLSRFFTGTKPVEENNGAEPVKKEPPKKTREEIEMEHMDVYYANFDFEKPDQVLMHLPTARDVSGMNSVANSAAPSPHQSKSHEQNENETNSEDQSMNFAETDAALALDAGIKSEVVQSESNLIDDTIDDSKSSHSKLLEDENAISVSKIDLEEQIDESADEQSPIVDSLDTLSLTTRTEDNKPSVALHLPSAENSNTNEKPPISAGVKSLSDMEVPITPTEMTNQQSPSMLSP
ncbi:kinase-like domain-containing protein [Globomyces pollinis-pini]|nr:kinase-like domain-containing protein [Globomyces pollinis-pini]